MSLRDKRLGYGKLYKDQEEGTYQFFGKECQNCSEGFVYTEEDLKKVLQELKIRMHNGLRCEDGYIRKIEADETLNEIFGEELFANSVKKE